MSAAVLASAVSSIVADGPAAGCRAIDVRVHRGLDLRLLPDRGLDIGAAWFHGTHVAWISPVGETAPLSVPRDDDWIRAFGGGLITTCGLRNVGAPSEGHGLHGAYSHQRATVLSVERDERHVSVRGRVREGDALDGMLELERVVTTEVGTGRVTLRDVTRNVGRDPEPAPVLYHVNLGAPLWDVGSSIAMDTREVLPRDPAARVGVDRWHECPGTLPGATERVLEHRVKPGPDGWAEAVVTGGSLVLTLRWNAATLPRLHQWIHPAPGIGVLGLEPANCSVGGRGADRAAGRLPVLAPGQERVTELEILCRPA